MPAWRTFDPHGACTPGSASVMMKAMIVTNAKLVTAAERYFAGLALVRASGKQSSYGPLAGQLNAVGATLKPRVFSVQELADQGSGIPISGYT